jgi:general secretion pathway protein L
LAAAVAHSGKVIVLVPAAQVLMTEAELPPGSGLRLARAVPFALEEHLSEDVDQLFFAIGRRRDDGRTPVAVVSLVIMRGWMAVLAAAGIKPSTVYVDLSLMPDNPSCTLLWLENGRLGVRRPGAVPFAVELSPISEALTVAGVIPDQSNIEAEPKVLENAILYATREDWAKVKGEFEKLVDQFASLKIQLLSEGPLPWLAREVTNPHAINLMQGEFAGSSDLAAGWRRWRVAALLGLGLLGTHVVAEALQIRQAHRQSAALDGEVAQVFSEAMPAEKMTEPRQQMQTRLDRIRKSGPGDQYFLRMLQALSGALRASPKTAIDSLSFRESALEMKITAPSLDTISSLAQSMKAQGMAAEIQSSTPTATGVDAHVQLRYNAARR